MAEIVGVDHVSIGTDQFDARGCVEDYTRWVHLVAGMLHPRGGQDRRRQLPAHLPRCGRLKVSNSSKAPCDERHLRQTAIVTGAASSIGLAIATALAEAGANVVMADIQKDGSKRQRTVSPGRTNARPPPGA
jgi:hypothetical protein